MQKKSITLLNSIINFRLNDIERATNAKSQVEQKQREEAKIRKDTNAEWDTKVIINKIQLHIFFIISYRILVF